MKKPEYITLNDRTFLNNSKAKNNPTAIDFDHRDIYYAYERPSQTKIDIWREWERWSQELPDHEPDIACCDIWISGHNCNFFSIGGRILYHDGKTALLHITKSRNIYWLV